MLTSSSALAAEHVGCVEQQGGEAAHQHDTEGDEEDPVARPPGPRPQPRPRPVTQLAPAAADPDTLSRGTNILIFSSLTHLFPPESEEAAPLRPEQRVAVCPPRVHSCTDWARYHVDST